MKSIHYLSREHLDKYWPVLKPLLEKGILLCQDEITIDQLRLLIVQGQTHVIVAVDNDTGGIIGALAFEITPYPNCRAMNIISLGGDNLFADEYDMEVLKGILKQNGISKIQGWCYPAQARLFSSKLGFTKTYQMVSLDIGE